MISLTNSESDASLFAVAFVADGEGRVVTSPPDARNFWTASATSSLVLLKGESLNLFFCSLRSLWKAALFLE